MRKLMFLFLSLMAVAMFATPAFAQGGGRQLLVHQLGRHHLRLRHGACLALAALGQGQV